MKHRPHTIGALAALMLCLAPAFADGLRNVKVGQPIPSFTMSTLSGGTLSSDALAGKVTVLVYISAEQRSSEKAAVAARDLARELAHGPGRDDLAVVFVTADVTRVDLFRRTWDRLDLNRHPLGLDMGRGVYGALGLIVLPTTVIIDPEGRLAHVIASYKSDYTMTLRAHTEHAMGLIDDDTLAARLTTTTFVRNRPSDRIARHRAAARMLRRSHLPAEAERELRVALELDANDADTLLDLASLQIDQGRLDDADTVVTRVLELHPDSRNARLLQGVLLYHRGDLDAADETLTALLLRNPDPIRTHYYLGLIKERQGDETAAIMHLKEALARVLADESM